MSRMIREVGYDWFNYVIVEDVDWIVRWLKKGYWYDYGKVKKLYG